MLRKLLKKVTRLIVVLLIFTDALLFKQVNIYDSEYVSANIDTGFTILLLIGLSFGAYRLYMNEKAD